MSSRDVVAMAAVHTSLKVVECRSGRSMSVMEMPRMLWKVCHADESFKGNTFLVS